MDEPSVYDDHDQEIPKMGTLEIPSLSHVYVRVRALGFDFVPWTNVHATLRPSVVDWAIEAR